MHTWLKNMSNQQNLMCGCDICISSSMIQCELNAQRSIHIETFRSYYEGSHSRWSGQGEKYEGINKVYPNGFQK